jgi:pantoate--beta-alanine ligase
MRIIRGKQELEQYLKQFRPSKSIGFVPTMGALHNGHLSLLEKAKEQDDIVICSIFVNPTQFNESSDYEKYPQVLDEDVSLLSKIDIDIVFAPNVEQIYPDNNQHIPHYDIGELDHVLEGEHRPGHFQGVCHIIHVFLQMMQPDHIYMGEKDIQQIAVVRKLIELKSHSTKLVACETLREESGLAMSSRNRLLSVEGTKIAAVFNQALNYIRIHSQEKPFDELKNEAFEMMTDVGFTPEYIALCDAKTLNELDDFDYKIEMRLIGAAFLEGVRLIDNIAL